MTVQVSIIIVNYNAGLLLRTCLLSLQSQAFSHFEVLIVDNASTDDSLASIPEDARFHVITLKENTGFAKANNIAAAQAEAPWLVTLNPDTIAEKDWLMQLMNAARRYPECIMFGSTQINAFDRSRIDGSGDIYHALGIPLRRHYGRPLAELPAEGPVFAPCAAAAMYRKDWFLYVGGFDEAFFCYCEDSDLAFRLRLYGGHCMQIRNAVVYHHDSAITGKKSAFSVYHGMRNRLWVFAKNMPSPLFELILPLHFLLLPLFLAKAAAKGQLKAGWRGMRDALLQWERVMEQRKKIQKGRKVSIFSLASVLSWNLLLLFRK